MAAPAIAGLKAEMAQLELKECQQLLAAAINCATAEEVAALLDKFSARRRAPLLAPELIVCNLSVASKPRRSNMRSTSFTSGPHDTAAAGGGGCLGTRGELFDGLRSRLRDSTLQNSAVRTNSLVLLKLNEPVEWASIDGAPVRTVILLAIRDADGTTEHMRVLSKLARQLMHDDFRARARSKRPAPPNSAISCNEHLPPDPADGVEGLRWIVAISLCSGCQPVRLQGR